MFEILGQLLEAARKYSDTRISAHFGVGDAVAVEMMYHRRCYRSYITKGPTTSLPEADRLVVYPLKTFIAADVCVQR